MNGTYTRIRFKLRQIFQIIPIFKKKYTAKSSESYKIANIDFYKAAGETEKNED